MPRHHDPAIERAISAHLQNELLPQADELLRRIQAAVLVLNDVECMGISLAVTERLEIVVVLLADAEAAAQRLKGDVAENVKRGVGQFGGLDLAT